MQHRDVAAADRGGVQVGAVPARLRADQSHGVVAERVEGADRVRAAADAGDDDVGEAAGRSSICARASRPITDWSSRTSVG